jgi:hypothetical protein
MDRAGYFAYQWLTSSQFLLPALFPHSVAIDAAPFDDPDRIMQQVGDAGWFHFHLNCTRTTHFPQRRAELLERVHARGLRTINADATDISKRAVQRACARAGLNTVAASRSGDPHERIMVKTDLNFGGDSEWALGDEERQRLNLGAGSAVMWKPHDYRVMERSEIPGEWWDDETLVQERFIENAQHRWFRVFLMLSRMVVCELTDPSLIKKVGHSSVQQVWTFTFPTSIDASDGPLHVRIAHDVHAFSSELGIEFGAVDVVVDGHDLPYIIDVNTTPAYNHPIGAVTEHLRAALDGDASLDRT